MWDLPLMYSLAPLKRGHDSVSLEDYFSVLIGFRVLFR